MTTIKHIPPASEQWAERVVDTCLTKMLALALTGKLEVNCLISFINAFTFADLVDKLLTKLVLNKWRKIKHKSKMHSPTLLTVLFKSRFIMNMWCCQSSGTQGWISSAIYPFWHDYFIESYLTQTGCLQSTNTRPLLEQWGSWFNPLLTWTPG